MRRATLRGEMVVPLDRSRPPFWFRNRYNNQLLISSRHLREGCVDAIIDELERFSPAMLQAYPSTAFALAQLLAQRNRRLKHPGGVYCFRTSLPASTGTDRRSVRRTSHGYVRHGGAGAFATECEFGAMHVNTDYSYVELLDADGQPARDTGYIVGTTFHNLVMPLVRYRLSDRTRWIAGGCRCGRPFPVIEPITGKWEDRIFGSDGAFVSPSVLTFAFKGLSGIRKCQVAQVGPARWEVRVVPAPGFSTNDGQKLVDNIHHLVDLPREGTDCVEGRHTVDGRRQVPLGCQRMARRMRREWLDMCGITAPMFAQTSSTTAPGGAERGS